MQLLGDALPVGGLDGVAAGAGAEGLPHQDGGVVVGSDAGALLVVDVGAVVGEAVGEERRGDEGGLFGDADRRVGAEELVGEESEEESEGDGDDPEDVGFAAGDGWGVCVRHGGSIADGCHARVRGVIERREW